jgi:hypothetical protein
MNGVVDLFGSEARHAVCDSLSNFSQIAQEIGHGYGLDHSRSVANPTDYENPYCIMSGMTFGGTDPTFDSRFGASGPGLCSPYLFAAGWLPGSRMVQVTTNGRSPASTVITLSPLGARAPRTPQVALVDLNTPQEVKYFVEYRAGSWDHGLVQTAVVVHQLRPDGYAYYAGHIPASVGNDDVHIRLPGKVYLDSHYDLSVELLSIYAEGTVRIRIASAAAVRTLSVRAVAREKLGLTSGFSIRRQVLQNITTSLRDRLVELLR